jgi:hypothetical protein
MKRQTFNLVFLAIGSAKKYNFLAYGRHYFNPRAIAAAGRQYKIRDIMTQFAPIDLLKI